MWFTGKAVRFRRSPAAVSGYDDGRFATGIHLREGAVEGLKPQSQKTGPDATNNQRRLRGKDRGVSTGRRLRLT